MLRLSKSKPKSRFTSQSNQIKNLGQSQKTTFPASHVRLMHASKLPAQLYQKANSSLSAILSFSVLFSATRLHAP